MYGLLRPRRAGEAQSGGQQDAQPFCPVLFVVLWPKTQKEKRSSRCDSSVFYWWSIGDSNKKYQIWQWQGEENFPCNNIPIPSYSVINICTRLSGNPKKDVAFLLPFL